VFLISDLKWIDVNNSLSIGYRKALDILQNDKAVLKTEHRDN
jgi:hypothetical protein